MLRIAIPEPLQEVLSRDSRLQSAVAASIEAFEPWLSDETAGLAFFPDFTDHGPKHINKVLRAAADLIALGAWPLITPDDVAGLIVAVLLHDSAMHLTEEGFLSLINGTYANAYAVDLGDRAWPETWNEFFAEARRWDRRKLAEVFGPNLDDQSADDDYVTYVKRPSEIGDPEKWPKLYRRFIGEFVRRYHARIAHDVAIFGAPGPLDNNQRIRLQGLGSESRDLFGLIARSHNISLRSTFDYLNVRFDGRVVCRNTHPVFLMVLLRIADFLDVDSQRAPRDLLKVRSLRSPISRQEWNAHHAIVEVRADEHDREALFVAAKPDDVSTFLRLRALLCDLQSELDLSWAVLGEVYSKQSDQRLDALAITLRRVRSNIDDVPQFIASSHPTFVPVHATFEAADADLLKLLIEPLYGDRPEVGARELLQNAIDAIRELDEFCRQKNINRGDVGTRKLANGALVEIRVHNKRNDPSDVPKDWERWIEVTDTGIGMSEDTIRNYFLKAGASFRKSDAWRRLFEKGEQEFGTSRKRVLRSGRFGIGVLAAFLIGPEIQVLTRYIGDEQGIAFSATIDTDNIELRFAKCPIGTRIRVKLAKSEPFIQEPPSPYDEDRPWDWFTLEEPRTVRADVRGKVLPQHFSLPSAQAPLPPDFHRVKIAAYDDFQWTHGNAPSLTCNGLIITQYWDDSYIHGYRRRLDVLNCGLFDFVTPNLSVFDSIGNLPLNLQRTELTTRALPFEDELADDVVRDFFAFFYLKAPTRPLQDSSETPEYYNCGYQPLRFHHNTAEIAFSPWFSTRAGNYLVDQLTVFTADLHRVLLVPPQCSVAVNPCLH
jgi:hypothetical protein